ncbi:MAG: cytochrome c biogenesis protein CcdA [Syntrophomonadaceae bacterium]|nr:cytochrome c biogenesis protein CcdA [Syntrophomonadaceae bacterium]
MLDWLTNTLSSLISSYSAIAFVLVFLGGAITSIGPCNISMVPVVMAYVGARADVDKKQSFWLSLAFTLGSSTTFMLLGVIIALIGGIFGFAQTVLYCLAALVCIAVGLSLLRVWSINGSWFTGLYNPVPQKKGIMGAFMLGMALGLAGSQCGTPILLAILSIVMLKGKIIYGAVLLFFYAVGRGVPVVLAGTFTGLIKSMTSLAKWSNVLENIAGLILILVGAYLIWIA